MPRPGKASARTWKRSPLPSLFPLSILNLAFLLFQPLFFHPLHLNTVGENLAAPCSQHTVFAEKSRIPAQDEPIVD